MADLNLNLGIDFGTSFTKVCVRDTDRDRSWVVTFCKSRPVLDEALLPTKLDICSDGRLLAGLTQSEWKGQTTASQASIDFLKMRLVNIDLSSEGQKYPSDPLQSFRGIDLNTPTRLENLCAYYLSSVILKAKAWVLQNNADLVKNQEINWSANVGVPVKYADSDAVKRFEEVLCLAWLLTESHPASFAELEERTSQLRRDLPREDIPCVANLEIAAAVNSYTVSRQAEPGIYIFFDVGSGTMEGASFRFWREDQMPMVEFYSGEVEPNGVNALAKQLANSSPALENEMVNYISHGSESFVNEVYSFSANLVRQVKKGEYIANKVCIGTGCQQLRVSVEAVEERLQQVSVQKVPDVQEQKLLQLIRGQRFLHRQVAEVVVTCKKKFPDYFRQSSSLRVFLGGGGKDAQYYRQTIQSTHSAFAHQRADIPVYDLREVPFPSDFDMSGINSHHFHRFAIAYGLSIPKDQAPEVRGLPKQFPDAPLPPPPPPKEPKLPTD